MSQHLLTLVLALSLDAAFGESRWLRGGLPHPVVVIGRLIYSLDRWLNLRPDHKYISIVVGTLASCIAMAIFTALAWLISLLLADITGGFLIEAVCASWFLAHRSLIEHVDAVATAQSDGIHAARKAVGMIVGRDTSVLDAHGVNRAVIESAAENYSDGIVAPALWFLLLGLPGIVLYKCINTLDSMIGYRNARFLYFGRFAARLDDVANLIPARMTALLMWCAAKMTGLHFSLSHLPQHAARHKSPNAGWPEAAMALALNLRLAGPRVYPHGLVQDEYIGTGTSDAETHHVKAAVRLACAVWWLMLTGLWLALLVLLVHPLINLF